jgi:dTDP-4-dehydrorhamnose 3,5-epimerase
VAVDIRPDSPTYLEWFGTELSAENQRLLYIPAGFAHGYQTLTDDAKLIYLVSEFYAPDAEGGLRFDDPAIGINWPLEISAVSEKDSGWPLITDI